MSDCKFIRKDRNEFGGRIAFYVNDQLPSLTIKFENPLEIEIPTIEMTILKDKILLQGYKSHQALVKQIFLLVLKLL